MIELERGVRQGFAQTFGTAPTLVASAPGRVNLIGEHTDYNDGWVLPAAIGVGTMVAARPRDDGMVRAVALDLDQSSLFSIRPPLKHAPSGQWCNYLRGVVSALQAQGLDVRGADLAIAGNVPKGAGLSSSASLEVAAGLALASLSGEPDYDRTRLALAGQRAEHDFAGCKCGIMDQLVSARADAGAALLIDCRSLETKAVAIAPQLGILIVHSGVRRELVEGEYNARREQCETAARTLGVTALRDADIAMVEAARSQLGPLVLRRARHVVQENARTLAAVDALAVGDVSALRALMAQSHASMRDDFEITVPEIDALVAQLGDLLGDSGGVRMTGGGFGGAVVAVAQRSRIDLAAHAIGRIYRTPAGKAPIVMVAQPAAGARLLR